MTQVINLYAGAGAGKSTTAAGLFYKMKSDMMSVELVSEYAKQLTWDDRHNVLTQDQLYILAKQHRKMLILKDKVDYIITDSPLLLSLIYKPKHYPKSFDDLVWYLYNQFENINIFLPRTKPYVTVGRNQTEEQAKEIDLRVYEKFDQIYDFIPSRAEHHGPVVDQVYDYIKHGVE